MTEQSTGNEADGQRDETIERTRLGARILAAVIDDRVRTDLPAVGALLGTARDGDHGSSVK